MSIVGSARRMAAVAVLSAFAVLSPQAAVAGEGRVDATNGDTFFNVHFRFPPTPQQIADVKSTMDMMAFGICDASDGQWRVKKVTLSQGQANEDKGDFWLHALPGRSGLSFFFSGANLGNLGSHVDMFSGAMTMPDVYLHEFGHHAWGLGDEYDEQSRFGGPCGIGPGFEAGTTDEQNHSIMQQTGSAQCVGGPSPGSGCFRNSQCGAGGTCQFVLMSELSVATNNDPLQGDGNNCPAVAAPGVMCPDNAYCMRAWNSGTTRYEQTQQSEIHSDDSDWETLDENYPFVTPPAGLPVAAAGATCFRAVEYQEDVVGSDQVMLILDKSGSMSWSSNPADDDVCGNGVDDDGDGTVDEATCGNARMTFVKAAANAYLDLQRDRNVDVGIITFATGNAIDRMIGTLNAGNIAAYKAIVDGMSPGGSTGIGDAMETSKIEFIRVATLGRSRTAYLMTDGENTSGTDPVVKANELRDIGVRVHVIPAGSDVSPDTLSGVAAATGGDLFPAGTMNDLTAIYAEMAGRHRGAAMALPRVNFRLSMRGGVGGVQENRTFAANFPPRQMPFPIFVEKNAKSLVAFVSGRNQRMSDWSMAISLRGPNGELFGPGSPELTVNPYYLFINVPNPAPGEWTLVADATGPAIQEATALAFIDNPEPDFFVSARPSILTGADKVAIAANPSFVSRLAREGVAISGRIEGPAGFTAPLSMDVNETGAWGASEGPFPYNGFYRAVLSLDVDASARPAEGEAIFSGPPAPPVAVTPFKRYGSAGFVVINGKDWPCASGDRNDCDGDGVPNKQECRKFGSDIDKDGRPNWYDADSDGDEIPDSVEKGLDLNQNRVPDMCERGEPRTAAPPKSDVKDNCVPLRRALLKPRLIGKSWRLTDENVSLLDFGGDGESVMFTLSMLNKYGATDLCYVGPKGRSMSYLLVDGKAPAGAIKGERCKAFDPERLSLDQDGETYVLRSGKEVLRSFSSKDEAAAALDIIRRHGFTNLCVAGRDKSGLEYMRR